MEQVRGFVGGAAKGRESGDMGAVAQLRMGGWGLWELLHWELHKEPKMCAPWYATAEGLREDRRMHARGGVMDGYELAGKWRRGALVEHGEGRASKGRCHCGAQHGTGYAMQVAGGGSGVGVRRDERGCGIGTRLVAVPRPPRARGTPPSPRHTHGGQRTVGCERLSRSPGKLFQVWNTFYEDVRVQAQRPVPGAVHRMYRNETKS